MERKKINLSIVQILIGIIISISIAVIEEEIFQIINHN